MRNIEIVELLLDKGAKVSAVDKVNNIHLFIYFSIFSHFSSAVKFYSELLRLNQKEVLFQSCGWRRFCVGNKHFTDRKY